ELEGHVAREAVGDDDVDTIRRDIPAFDVADEVDVRRLEERRGRPDELASLPSLLADRQQADPGLRDPEPYAAEDRAQDGETGEMLGPDVRVGARIEQDRRRGVEGQDDRDRGP